MAASCLPPLRILQAHGLTAAVLEQWAAFAAQGKTGAFLFHMSQGTIVACEARQRWRVTVCEELVVLAQEGRQA